MFEIAKTEEDLMWSTELRTYLPAKTLTRQSMEILLFHYQML